MLEKYVSLSPTYVCNTQLHSEYIPYVNTRVAHDIQSVYAYVKYPLVLVVKSVSPRSGLHSDPFVRTELVQKYKRACKVGSGGPADRTAGKDDDLSSLKEK